jgi:hypothetical protein
MSVLFSLPPVVRSDVNNGLYLNKRRVKEKGEEET